MTTPTAGLLLKRALRQLTPDIFLHPVWYRFACPETAAPAGRIQPLLRAAKSMQAEGDVYGACSLLFLCAAEQARLDDYPGAIASIEQALKLARRRRLRQFVMWGYWGAAAVCLRHGAFQRAAGYLRELHEIIKAGGDWVLANLVEMISQPLERLADTGRGPGAAAVIDPSLQAALDALRRWGEVPPETSPAYPAERSVLQPGGEWGWRAVLRRTLQWMRGEREPTWVEDVPCEVISAAVVSGELAARESEPPPAPPDEPLPEPLQRKPGLIEIQMYFLGSFRICQDEQYLADWPSQKSLSILKYLAANRGKPIPKDVLMDQFWAETEAEVARRNLHQAIYALRQALKRAHPDFPYILFENDCYRLNPDLEIWLDFEEFEKHVRSARRLEESGSASRAIAEYGIAEALYQGDFLEEDLYEDWPNTLRVHYRGLYLDLLERLSAYHFAQKQYYAAILLCQKMLAKDNCAEQAYRCLIRCYLAQGQRQLAAREYQACVQTLKRELNLAPSEETRDLYPLIFSSKPS